MKKRELRVKAKKAHTDTSVLRSTSTRDKTENVDYRYTVARGDETIWAVMPLVFKL